MNGEGITYAAQQGKAPLVADQRDLTFSFAAIGDERTWETEYSYRLGEEGEWSNWSTTPNVGFFDLASGAYRLYLRARTPGMQVSPRVTSLAFTVDLPLAEEPYFPTLVNLAIGAALVVASILLLFLYRLNRQRARYNRQLADKNAQITAQNQRIQSLRIDQQHRTMNNLRILSIIIEQQQDQLRDSQAVRALEDARHRLEAVALIHQQLDPASLGKEVELLTYLEQLTRHFAALSQQAGPAVHFKVSGEQRLLPVNHAVYLGIIVNELLTNSLKYAFADTPQPLVQISLQQLTPHSFELVYQDNGKGLPSDLIEQADSVGMYLIRRLTEQLRGEMSYDSLSGATFRFRFPFGE
jgi:two-component sensor histidine kinase